MFDMTIPECRINHSIVCLNHVVLLFGWTYLFLRIVVFSQHRLHTMFIVFPYLVHSYLDISTTGEPLTFGSTAVRSRRGCGAAGGRAQTFLDALAMSTIPPNAADNTIDIRAPSPPAAACGTSGRTAPPAAVGSSRVLEYATDRTHIKDRSLTPISASPSMCTSMYRPCMHNGGRRRRKPLLTDYKLQ